MKVVHVINSLSTGGAERLTVDLTREGREQGHDVSIVCLARREGLPQSFAEKHSLDVTCLAVHRYDPRLATRLRAAVRDADIVHAHLFPTLYWVTRSSQPVVFTEHSTANRRMTSQAWRPAEKFAYGKLSSVAAISPGVERSLASHFGRLDVHTPLTVIPNGIRGEFFEVGRAASAPSGALNLAAVGSLSPVKNFELAIRAVAQVPRVRLDIAGDGPLRQELTDLTKQLGVSDRVRLLGLVTDMPGFLAAHDVLISTSHYEGFSLAAAEAMAVGLPVIGPNVAGFNDVVTHDKTGLLFNEPTVPAVATLIRALSDPDILLRLAAHSRGDSGRFSITTCFDQYLKLYESVLS